MVNFNMGSYRFRKGLYQIWTHELFGQPAFIIAIAEREKGQWSIESVVKHFCKVAEKKLTHQKPVSEEEIKQIVEEGKRFNSDPGYLNTGAIPYNP